jgi:hypothetical protein
MRGAGDPTAVATLSRDLTALETPVLANTKPEGRVCACSRHGGRLIEPLGEHLGR